MSRRPHFLMFALASFFVGALWSQAEAMPKQRVSKRAAPVYNLKAKNFRAKITSKKVIRKAAEECLQGVLERMRPGGHMTVAEWNGVDPKSVKLASVKVLPGKVGFDGSSLSPTQVRFEARYKVMMGRDKLKPAKLYLRSEMELKQKASFNWAWASERTNSPQYYGGVRSQSFAKKDDLTVTWID